MTLTIELTPQEQRRVLGARAHGINVQAIIRGMIAGLPELDSVAEQEGTMSVTPAEATRLPRPTPAELEAFLAEFAEAGRGKGYLLPEAFEREHLYEDRL